MTLHLDDPRHEPQPAAEARVIQWIAGGLAALLVTAGGAWLSYVGAQVDGLRAEQKTEVRENSDIRERLKGVETRLEAVDETTKATRQDVQRIRESLEAARTRSGDWSMKDRTSTSDGR